MKPALAVTLALCSTQACAQLVVGSDAGQPPEIRLYDVTTGMQTGSFLAFDPLFSGGVRVATGDVNGDNVPDIIAGAGPGGLTLIKVFDGTDNSIIHEFFPYGSRFPGGVNVAVGDVNGDGFEDIITGPYEAFGPIVKAFDGTDLTVLHEITAYDPLFEGGVNVACGDINGDGVQDIVTGMGPGAQPWVKAFNGDTGSGLASDFVLSSFVTAGIIVGCGDTDNDGMDEVIAAPQGPVGALVQVFNYIGGGLFNDTMFFAFDEPNFGGPTRIASSDINNDGFDDIILGAGPWTNTAIGPVVEIRSGNGYGLLDTFFAGDPLNNLGIFVAGPWQADCPADVNGDGNADPADFTAWLACYNDPMSAPYCTNADVNNDGNIDPADFTAWLAAFNAGCD